jgi:cell division protein FtsI (penicillin-binding protein 3)
VSAHYASTHSRTRVAPRPARVASRMPRRLNLLRALLSFVFVLLALRLIQIQIFDHAHYVKLSVAQVRENLTTTALRAGVYDRNGQILAVSRPTSRVVADDFQITHPLREAEAMSPLVKVPVSKLTALFSEKNGYVVVNNQLDLSDGRRLTSAAFPGIVVQSSSNRSYPNGTLAQSILGGVNNAGVGTSGLEYEYQKQLAGQSGITSEFVSASGVSLPGSRSTVLKKAAPGTGLELTIDSSLQFVTERALAKQLKATGGVTGVAIVMDVKTGQILADASLVNTTTPAGVLGPVPSWGSSVGVAGIDQTVNNLAFTQAYEPGSVFKVVTFSAALQAGLMSPSTVFAVPNSVQVGGRHFHDAEIHSLEHLSATQVLAQSSNIGTYEIGKLVGENGILAQVERLGFGATTSVSFPGETSGLLVNTANWYGADQVALPIGQVDAVPPIQVLDAYNTIANNGVFVEPQLVRGYVYANGTVKSAPASSSREALTPSVAGTMSSMLQQVVLDGTGTNAIIPGYSVAGKTGTASIPYPGRDALLSHAYNASFVGFAPANAPVLSMLVVIERPTSTIFGGAVSAPVFQQVMSYALHHYGIPSNGTIVKPLTGAGASIGSDVT